MDAGRSLYFLLVLLWIGVTGLNANVGTFILLIKAAFPFMRIICPTDFAVSQIRIKLFLTLVSLCVDFCTDYLLTGPARLTRGFLQSQSFRKPCLKIWPAQLQPRLYCTLMDPKSSKNLAGYGLCPCRTREPSVSFI